MVARKIRYLYAVGIDEVRLSVAGVGAMGDRSEHEECPDFAARARAGELAPTAIEQIIACFHHRLEVFATTRCADPDLGQDAYQDAMLTLLGTLESYRGEAPIEPWLRRLVVGACSRLRRGRKNAPSVNLPLDGQAVAGQVDARPPADLRLELEAEFARVAAALRSLPELNRELIYLHEGEGITIGDLAERFELSAEAVKSRLKRARAELRRTLRPE